MPVQYHNNAWHVCNQSSLLSQPVPRCTFQKTQNVKQSLQNSVSIVLILVCCVHFLQWVYRPFVMMTLDARQQKRHRCIEWTFRFCGRGRGWHDLGEWHWNMYNIIYETITSPGLMHDTGCLGLVHWDDPEGWYGEGGGVRMGNTCLPVVDSCWCMAKPIQYCKAK